MRARWVLAAVLTMGVGPMAWATDLTKIPRTIRKEPVYRGVPGYCLLVFGKDAGTRRWLVRDGVDFYFDRNGNGDLTEPGERFTSNGTSVGLPASAGKDGTGHPQMILWSYHDGTFRLLAGESEQRQFVGYGLMGKPRWGDRPERAPILHLGGPLSLERYGPMVRISRMGSPRRRAASLMLLLGTPGLGEGTFASYPCGRSRKLGALTADIDFPSTKPGQTVRRRIELKPDS